MSINRMDLANGYWLSSLSADDTLSLVAALADGVVQRTTDNVPHPYTLEDAKWWVDHRAKRLEENKGIEVEFAIRAPDGTAVGSVGASGHIPGIGHKAEIGYWIATSHSRKGITTAALSRFVEYAFAELGLERMFAKVYASNIGSCRVLEKNGFLLEGRLRQHVLLAGKLEDDLVYGLLRVDWQQARG